LLLTILKTISVSFLPFAESFCFVVSGVLDYFYRFQKGDKPLEEGGLSPF